MMTIPVFIIVAIVYCLIGIGCTKVISKLNCNDPDFDLELAIVCFIAWPLVMIVCSFWNFKND